MLVRGLVGGLTRLSPPHRPFPSFPQHLQHNPSSKVTQIRPLTLFPTILLSSFTLKWLLPLTRKTHTSPFSPITLLADFFPPRYIILEVCRSKTDKFLALDRFGEGERLPPPPSLSPPHTPSLKCVKGTPESNFFNWTDETSTRYYFPPTLKWHLALTEEKKRTSPFPPIALLADIFPHRYTIWGDCINHRPHDFWLWLGLEKGGGFPIPFPPNVRMGAPGK